MRQGSGTERGFTLIELLVGIALFSIVSIGFYQVLLATSGASQTTRDITQISGEARLGFNRLVRDTREADEVRAITANSYEIFIDFDGDGQPAPAPTDLAGSHEVVRYRWNSVQKTITITSGATTEVLMSGVDCVRNVPSACAHPVFSYASSRLEFDSDGDGLTEVGEMDVAPVYGDGLGGSIPTGQELDIVDIVAFTIALTQGDSTSTMYAEAQLRNNR